MSEDYEATVYQMNRWECPVCEWIHESDSDFAETETCESCLQKVHLK